MKRALKIGAILAGTVVAGIAAAVTAGAVRWNRETARGVARLRTGHDAEAPPFSRDDLAGLPDPVVRYFEFALTPGQPMVRNARFGQVGEFAMPPGRWSPFTAVEYFATDPPGFLWDARIKIASAISVYVRDAYCAGEGAMYGAAAALVPVVNKRGTPAMASGELLRYLSEAVFFPTALLPRDGISWKPLGERSARVTLTDANTTVSCEFDFNERNEIVRMSAMREFPTGGTFVLTPWVGRYSNYRRVEGMMVPMSAEIEWILPDGLFPYWRGRNVDAHYDFAPITSERDRPDVPIAIPHAR
jgi:hypothetical protein